MRTWGYWGVSTWGLLGSEYLGLLGSAAAKSLTRMGFVRARVCLSASERLSANARACVRVRVRAGAAAADEGWDGGRMQLVLPSTAGTAGRCRSLPQLDAFIFRMLSCVTSRRFRPSRDAFAAWRRLDRVSHGASACLCPGDHPSGLSCGRPSASCGWSSPSAACVRSRRCCRRPSTRLQASPTYGRRRPRARARARGRVETSPPAMQAETAALDLIGRICALDGKQRPSPLRCAPSPGGSRRVAMAAGR